MASSLRLTDSRHASAFTHAGSEDLHHSLYLQVVLDGLFSLDVDDQPTKDWAIVVLGHEGIS